MIDYDKPDDDPIVAEVRQAREALLAQFSYDLNAMFEHFRAKQASQPQGYVSLPPRRPKGRIEPPVRAG